ncbi:hypothetical protein MNBD_UNCLBAC01-872, partial [hydrothermal vent metagenome]
SSEYSEAKQVFKRIGIAPIATILCKDSRGILNGGSLP